MQSLQDIEGLLKLINPDDLKGIIYFLLTANVIKEILVTALVIFLLVRIVTWFFKN